MIIAIDGPAGSGKSSTARAVAEALGFRHLDSGAFYRALTLAALRAGIPVEEWSTLTASQLASFGVRAEPAAEGLRFLLNGEDVSDAIRATEVNANVSAMARVPFVREWLMDTLRDTATRADLVADGRDIGTVVFPQAELKVFLVADPRERARRRLLQMGLELSDAELEAEVERIVQRDRIDSTRETAPLKRADDAIVIDTTSLTFDEQVAHIVALARRRPGP